jgi:hypothetical protein
MFISCPVDCPLDAPDPPELLAGPGMQRGFLWPSRCRRFLLGSRAHPTSSLMGNELAAPAPPPSLPMNTCSTPRHQDLLRS